MKKLLQLRGAVSNDEWGKPFETSLVAKFSDAKDATKRYSELWLGAHPNDSAQVVTNDESQSLEGLLRKSGTEILGKDVFEKYSGQLPFLFKVLSIAEPLSIQAHPSKQHAERLHELHPDIYLDDNHKPEAAIALTPVDLLYGFLPWNEIKKRITSLHEFSLLLDAELIKLVSQASDKGAVFDQVLMQLFRAESSRLEEACQTIYQRALRGDVAGPCSKLFMKLSQLYPQGDVGVPLVYLMGIESLEPGQGVFIGPNVPHAYLSGDLVECMANSDNVVRAGLTPKYKDVETLIEMSSQANAPFEKLSPQALPDGVFQTYPLSAEEFSLDVAEGSFSGLEICANGGPHLLFCYQGQADVSCKEESERLTEGASLLINSGTSYTCSLNDGTLYRARVS